MTATARSPRVGAVLRDLGLDEIPQLVNVLRGDMALVGPRALTGADVRRLGWDAPSFDLRWNVPPGITGRRPDRRRSPLSSANDLAPGPALRARPQHPRTISPSWPRRCWCRCWASAARAGRHASRKVGHEGPRHRCGQHRHHAGQPAARAPRRAGDRRRPGAEGARAGAVRRARSRRAAAPRRPRSCAPRPRPRTPICSHPSVTCSIAARTAPRGATAIAIWRSAAFAARPRKAARTASACRSSAASIPAP